MPGIAERFSAVRDWTESLAAPLSAEDQTVQSMPDVSPTKWHRAHTTWFFETFVLSARVSQYAWVEPAYSYLFNSYYEAVGARYPRSERGLVSRPGAAEVGAYRREVDRRMLDWLEQVPEGAGDPVVELGLHHEQQHQELLLMDIKHVLSRTPMRPAYVSAPEAAPSRPVPLGWIDLDGGVVEVGHVGAGFHFDNESPQHRVLLEPYRIADRLVTAGEWMDFIEDGGYHRHDLWLSDGIGWVRAGGIDAPLYWFEEDGRWWQHTLTGTRLVDPTEPVCHVSHYEADAYATWAGARLPTEAEWEHAVVTRGAQDDTVPAVQRWHPRPDVDGGGLRQASGHVWQWTASAYLGYPGFTPPAGAIGEYNGKFMSGQMVLRGGSALTPTGHSRPTYRNFFPAPSRWVMSGVRLAGDAA